ncbi:MAG: ankyrin repeat domain-containing protein [Polyangiaceae bacterium]|jgi:hypothetical protein|nr:ankyrin repeat domain-containing protein [Polyangiaceae bacterium]
MTCTNYIAKVLLIAGACGAACASRPRVPAAELITYGQNAVSQGASQALPPSGAIEVFSEEEAEGRDGKVHLALYVKNASPGAVTIHLRQNVVRPRQPAVVRLVGEGVTELQGPDGPETHGRIGEPDRITLVHIPRGKTLRFLTEVPLAHYARSRKARPRARWELDLADGRRSGEVPVRLPPPSLLEAAQRGDASDVEAALDDGASVNEEDHLGRTALTFAIHGKNVALVRLLLGRGAAPGPAIFDAAARGRAEIVRLLVQSGANPSAPDERSQDTPLHWASGNGQVETVKVLLSLGAALNPRNKWGKTPLNAARSSSAFREEREATISLLLGAGATE